MARNPGETNSFITVDHDVLCYWLTVTPSPPHYHRSRSEYLINPSLSNNSIIVNFSISAGKLEQKHEDEGQGDLYCRKIVVSTHWKVGMEWKGEGSVLVHSNIILISSILESYPGLCLGHSLTHSLSHSVCPQFFTKRKGKHPCQLSVWQCRD